MEKRDQIKEYWNERAREYGSSPAATTEDVYLRELEISTVVRVLRAKGVEGGHLIDVGCGDGHTTLAIARAFPDLRVHGCDYGEEMITLATGRLEHERSLEDRVSFFVADVTNLTIPAKLDRPYDVALTVRCLINLESFGAQRIGVGQIASVLRPGGIFVAIENFVEGHDNMNAARESLGLPQIPIRWHNRYFRENEFISAVDQYFTDVSLDDFSSSYYFATRVIYSAYCMLRGEAPDYRHEIHQLASRLPPFGQFSPIRLAVMRRRSE